MNNYNLFDNLKRWLHSFIVWITILSIFLTTIGTHLFHWALSEWPNVRVTVRGIWDASVVHVKGETA